MRKLTLFLFIFISLNNCYAQLIHTKGIPSIGITGGLGSKSFIPGISFQHYLSDVSRLGINLKYNRITFPLSAYQCVVINPDYGYTLIKVSKKGYLNVKGGLLAGFENIKNEIFPSKNGILFGENIGISFEYFLTDKLKIEPSVEQFFFQHSLVLNSDYYIGISIYKQLSYKTNKSNQAK